MPTRSLHGFITGMSEHTPPSRARRVGLQWASQANLQACNEPAGQCPRHRKKVRVLLHNVPRQRCPPTFYQFLPQPGARLKRGVASTTLSNLLASTQASRFR